MDFVVSWLNQIVLIVLFAIVLDLIIPSSSMQKYVKLVMGLMIMVTLLKPVALLFDQNLDISKIRWPDNIAEFASLDSIKSRAGELQKQQASTAEKQMQLTLEKTIKQQLESQHPVEVLKVQADIVPADGQQNASLVISKLRIEMRPAAGSNKNGQIVPVESVQINSAKDAGKQAEPQTDSQQTEMSSQIQRELSTQFGISGSIISIDWKAG